MKKKNNLSVATEYNSWITFYLNYLNPHFSEQNFPLFQKKWPSYWKLFQLWKAKELETQAIKVIVEQLITEKKSWTYLIKQYQKNPEIDRSLIFSTWEKLWNADLARKYLTKPQNVQNFLLGQIRKTFPNSDIRKLNQAINDFIKSKTVGKL